MPWASSAQAFSRVLIILLEAVVKGTREYQQNDDSSTIRYQLVKGFILLFCSLYFEYVLTFLS